MFHKYTVWQLWKLQAAKQTGHVKDSITLSRKIFLAISFCSSFPTNGKNYPLSNYLHWSFNPLRTSESSLFSQAEERQGGKGRRKEEIKEGKSTIHTEQWEALIDKWIKYLNNILMIIYTHWQAFLRKHAVGKGSWESLGLQGDPTNQSERKSVLNIHWKDWCWSWSSNPLTTWCKELTHWKRPWCWERLKVGGEGDDTGWDGWMVSPTRWTWVWVNSGSWWWAGRPGMLQSMGSQRVGNDGATELNWCLIPLYSRRTKFSSRLAPWTCSTKVVKGRRKRRQKPVSRKKDAYLLIAPFLFLPVPSNIHSWATILTPHLDEDPKRHLAKRSYSDWEPPPSPRVRRAQHWFPVASVQADIDSGSCILKAEDACHAWLDT